MDNVGTYSTTNTTNTLGGAWGGSAVVRWYALSSPPYDGYEQLTLAELLLANVGHVYASEWDEDEQLWLYTTTRYPTGIAARPHPDSRQDRMQYIVDHLDDRTRREDPMEQRKNALTELVSELYTEETTESLRATAEHVLGFWRDVLGRVNRNGGVLTYVVSARVNPRRPALQYAVIRIDDQWYVTGRQQDALTELELIERLIEGDVTEARIASFVVADEFELAALPSIEATSTQVPKRAVIDSPQA